ncbi:tRNA-uridine aminocarboxypropyltransferase [Vibrio palustris]|nr:tRNA-uridine aminocarboxypropyltransferase [Vibrio palustris]
MRIHGFHHLYQLRLKQSTKPFVARGSQVERCEYCRVAKAYCLCAHQPNIQTQVAAMLILSDNEIFKPSNTGRLIADTIQDTHVFQWHRTNPPAEMLSQLENHNYAPVLVFPATSADDHAKVVTTQNVTDSDKTPLLVFIDGSWREARRIYRKSAYLQSLPLLSMQPETVSDYIMRKSENEQYLATAEVASLVLQGVGEAEAAKTLRYWFNAFKETYLMTKSRGLQDESRPQLSLYLQWKDSITRADERDTR